MEVALLLPQVTIVSCQQAPCTTLSFHHLKGEFPASQGHSSHLYPFLVHGKPEEQGEPECCRRWCHESPLLVGVQLLMDVGWCRCRMECLRSIFPQDYVRYFRQYLLQPQAQHCLEHRMCYKTAQILHPWPP